MGCQAVAFAPQIMVYVLEKKEKQKKMFVRQSSYFKHYHIVLKYIDALYWKLRGIKILYVDL